MEALSPKRAVHFWSETGDHDNSDEFKLQHTTRQVGFVSLGGPLVVVLALDVIACTTAR